MALVANGDMTIEDRHPGIAQQYPGPMPQRSALRRSSIDYLPSWPEWVPDIAAQCRDDDARVGYTMTGHKQPILLATIGAAQGLKGEVRLNSMTAKPLAVTDYGVLSGKDGRTFTIERARQQKDIVIVKFKGIDDRTSAEALRGTELFVERAVLDKVEVEEDEFLYQDLVGLNVTDEAGHEWGQVTGVFDFGGGDVVEIKGADGKLRMIPFSKAAVPVVDIANGRLGVNRLASGIEDAKEGEE